jgi:hypothetical protein
VSHSDGSLLCVSTERAPWISNVLKIRIAALADAQQTHPVTRATLSRHQARPGGALAAGLERFGIPHRGDRRRGTQQSHPGVASPEFESFAEVLERALPSSFSKEVGSIGWGSRFLDHHGRRIADDGCSSTFHKPGHAGWRSRAHRERRVQIATGLASAACASPQMLALLL